MSRIILALLALVGAGLIYFLRVLIKFRHELDGLPSPPMKNILVGHLHIAVECARLFPPGVHPHVYARYMKKKFNLGDCFYVDWWPLGPRFLYIADPVLIGKYVTTGQSLPKSSLQRDWTYLFLGKNNMVGLEGQEWKRVRSIFNPGFSASHLTTLVPYIVDATLVFCNVMEEKARTNALIKFEDSATRLTIDIIGKVVLNSDLNSQKENHIIVKLFRERMPLMPETKLVDLSWFEFRRRYRLWMSGKRLDRVIGEELDRKVAERMANKNTFDSKSQQIRKKSIIDLALDSYENEQMDSNMANSKIPATMDANFRSIAIDSMKTFIFAGHDTTASTLAYVFYLLHLRPKVWEKLVAEIDSVFGVDCTRQSIAAAMKQNPYIISQLEYTTAIIKETLRMFPPASTMRVGPKASNPEDFLYMIDPKTGQKLPLSGHEVWPLVNLVGRNEDFFPQPIEFIPERFIPSQTPFPEARLHTPEGKEAWRPFEKGPRNCIGQELAMIEMRAVIALTVKDFDFVAEFDGVQIDKWSPIETYDEYRDGIPGTTRKTVEGHRCYQILSGAAKPCDGMPGRVSLRKQKT